MALKPTEKPMLPAADRIQCAADENCKYAGRMWVDGYKDRERICVEHYYRWMDERRGVKA